MVQNSSCSNEAHASFDMINNAGAAALKHEASPTSNFDLRSKSTCCKELFSGSEAFCWKRKQQDRVWTNGPRRH